MKIPRPLALCGALVSLQRFASSVVAVLMLFHVAGAEAATVLRTVAYHQITSFPNPGCATLDHELAISANGGKIAFARPYYGGPSRSNLIYTVNFDGSGLTLADMYAVNDCYPEVDISADGTKVLSWDNYGAVRMVNSDGSSPHQVIQLNGAYTELRLAPDGSVVYFSADRPFSTTPDTGSHDTGIYAVNANGTGFRQVIGVTNIAAFFGVTPSQVTPDGYMYGWNGGKPFGISGDGAHLACFAYSPSGYRLLALNVNGTGLHELVLAPTQITSFNNVNLSGNGSNVFYYIAYSPCCSTGEELGMFNWDGTGRRVLLSNYSTNQSSGPYLAQRVSVNQDGSKVLFGETSWLVNGDGSGFVQLAWGGCVTEVLKWGFYRAVMSSTGTRFAYLDPRPDGSQLQVATAEINPASLGAAPALNNLSATPAYVVTNYLTSTFLSSRPTPTNTLYGNNVGVAAFRNGQLDTQVSSECLADTGSGGDAVAGDGAYSRNGLTASPQAVIGPRTLRFKAEVVDSGTNYHATAVDLAPFFVTSQAPSNPAPTITSITPSSVSAGGQITIAGTGFDPVASNNVVLIGNQQAQVVSANGGGTQLVATVPGSLAPGVVSVTVSSFGQTSVPANLTVLAPGTIRLGIRMVTGPPKVAGLDIYGTTGKTYRIDYTGNLLPTNVWTPLSNVFLPTSPFFWIDTNSAGQSRRFYRSVELP